MTILILWLHNTCIGYTSFWLRLIMLFLRTLNGYNELMLALLILSPCFMRNTTAQNSRNNSWDEADENGEWLLQRIKLSSFHSLASHSDESIGIIFNLVHHDMIFVFTTHEGLRQYFQSEKSLRALQERLLVLFSVEILTSDSLIIIVIVVLYY